MSVILGFSANAEVRSQRNGVVSGDKCDSKITVRLGGASANAALALKQLGGDPKLLALIGPDNDPFSLLLRHCIISSGVRHHYLQVLHQTSRAVIIAEDSHSKVHGERGIPKMKLDDVIEKIRTMVNGSFVVAGSARLEELALSKALLQGASKGKRFLHLHHSFCGHRDMGEITTLADIMVLNKAEADKCRMSLSEMHNLGPEVIIVTEAEKGGICSLKNGSYFFYKAVTDYREHFTSDTGAGDVFNGALVHAMATLGLTAFDLNDRKTFNLVVVFAADIAAQHVAFGEIKKPQAL